MKLAISPSSLVVPFAVVLCGSAGCGGAPIDSSGAGGEPTTTTKPADPTTTTTTSDTGGTGGSTVTGGTGGATGGTGGAVIAGGTGGTAGEGGSTVTGGTGGATGGSGGVGGSSCVPVSDGNPCTNDICESGVPVHVPAPAGIPCPEAGTVCNGSGQCVGCLSAADCPGADTECAQRTCVMAVCGTAFTAQGTQVAAQAAHDCQANVCNGAGSVVSQSDPTDPPLDDGNICTAEVCVAGAPGHVPVANGLACSDGDACTQTDTCQNGVCTGGNPVTCGPGKTCDQGVCTGFCAPTLLPKVALAANEAPYQVAVGDINGDGHLDIAASSDAGTDFVSVWLNSGNGTFPTRSNPSLGPTQTGCSIADVNGDGKGDLVIALQEAVSAGVLLGAANGTFTAGAGAGLLSYPSYLTAGDFNGDARPDFAVVDTDVVSVLLTNGDGSLGTRTDYAALGGFKVIAGDFNADAKADLAVTLPSTNEVAVYMNMGNGTFLAPVAYAVGPNPAGLFAADLNGDGKGDLAVASFDASVVSVLLNNGNGTFAPKVDYPVGQGPYDVVAGDIDEDGAPELVSTNVLGHSVSLMVNLGNGTFAPAVDFAGTEGASTIAAGDLNGDTQPDFVVSNANTSEVYIFSSGCAP